MEEQQEHERWLWQSDFLGERKDGEVDLHAGALGPPGDPMAWPGGTHAWHPYGASVGPPGQLQVPLWLFLRTKNDYDFSRIFRETLFSGIYRNLRNEYNA